jgi:hypothetical protein
MVGKDGPGKASTSTSTVVASAGVQQRKGSIVDWVSIRPRAVTPEEKQHWVSHLTLKVKFSASSALLLLCVSGD